uniref:Methyladenine glycosylase n=1 Tax=Araucaria cunninghamii TaxID=56994 RepID=A0A0D6RAK1_ARACU
MWSFVGYKPIINRYRYPRQVPARTPKAEAISRDLLKRGFRFVGPTVIYSFMQVAGMTNDHLVHCFRWEECVFLSRGLQLEQYNKVQAEDLGEREREGDVKRLIRQP